ncbi:MAG TPA: hypothetical protein VFY29_08910 [Terriglobia bacterium]|nr:hypothetical protein [Terriglobia bacterium]
MTFRARKTGNAVLLILLSIAALVPGVRAQTASRAVTGRVVMESGAMPQRFTLPITSPGKTSTVVITPDPDGSFQATLPTGMSMVGAPASLPAGTTVLNLTFGNADLLKEPLVVDTTGNAQMIVTLRGPRPVNISGRVTGLASTNGVLVALQGSTSMATSRGGAAPNALPETLIRPDGTFSLTDVPPGSYRVRVIGGFLEKTVTISVGSADVTDLNIAMPQERFVTGLVIVDEYDGPVPSITAEARSTDGRVLPSAKPSAYEGVNTGQFFIFRMSNGEYRISVTSIPSGYKLKSVTYGDTDLQKEPLKLDGIPFWNIVVRLTRER